MGTRILRLPEVLKLTGLAKTAIYAAMNRGQFPKSISLLGGRSRGWVESEVEAFLQDQIAASRAA